MTIDVIMGSGVYVILIIMETSHTWDLLILYFVEFGYGSTWLIFSEVPSMALGQSHNYISAFKVTWKNIGMKPLRHFNTVKIMQNTTLPFVYFTGCHPVWVDLWLPALSLVVTATLRTLTVRPRATLHHGWSSNSLKKQDIVLESGLVLESTANLGFRSPNTLLLDVGWPSARFIPPGIRMRLHEFTNNPTLSSTASLADKT